MAERRRVVCPNCDSTNSVPADRPADAAKCGRCHAKLFPHAPIELSGDRARKHLQNSDVPVIVDFWAARSKINVDENPDLAAQYGVQGIPALFAFQKGQVAARQSGVADLGVLRGWVERLAP